MVKGDLDVAAVPCNLASVLYNKTEGQVVIAAVNTLGVLYIVERVRNLAQSPTSKVRQFTQPVREQRRNIL